MRFSIALAIALGVAVPGASASGRAASDRFYVAASIGAWTGIVDSDGRRFPVPASAFGRLAFAPDSPLTASPAGTHAIRITTIGGRARTLATDQITAPPSLAAGGRVAYGAGARIGVVGGATIAPRLPRGARIVELAYAPDSSRVAVTAEWGNGRAGTLANALYVVSANGSTRLLTRGANAYSERFGPSWAPDGLHLAFVLGGDIWTIGADGRDQRRVTATRATETGPLWSPDGTRVAYTSVRNGINEAYVANRDGTGTRRLTFTKSHGADVPQVGTVAGAWSRDGASLAVVSYNSVGVVPADGGRTRILKTFAPEESTHLGPIGWPR